MLLTNLILFCCAALHDGPTPTPKLSALPFDAEKMELRIDELAKAAIEKEGVPGLSIAVAVKGDVVFAKGYGYADAAHALPAKKDTKYAVGSITRQFTAMAILLLVDHKQLALDDELSKLLPGFPAGGRKITIEQMLSNTSGIPGFAKVQKKHEAIAQKALTEPDFYACFAGVPFDFEPGGGFALDSANYVLLSMIVARVSKVPYTDYIKTNLLVPLGLADTTFCPDAGRPPGFAVDCETVSDESEFEIPLGRRAGITTQSLCSTAIDLVKWQQALFEQGLLSASASWHLMQPVGPDRNDAARYGYAMQMGRLGRFEYFSHTSVSGGSRARVSFYSDPLTTIVVLSNCATAPVDRIERDIARFVLSLPVAKNEEIALPAGDANLCAGTYQLATTMIQVLLKDGELWYTPPTQEAVRLRYQGNLTFLFENDLDARITFHASEGKCEGFTLVRGGLERTAKRMD